MAISTDITGLKRSFEEMESSKLEIDDQISSSEFCPRSYQKELFEVARKQNTIAVLPTGAGKTMIAVMLIKQVAIECNQKKLIIFLAPTVSLVHQQYEVIKKHTNLKVGKYFGALGVDDWDLKCWNKETEEHD
ncbi:Endoribonuclease dicer-like protein, partial [Thalictrum thalictroides]